MSPTELRPAGQDKYLPLPRHAVGLRACTQLCSHLASISMLVEGSIFSSLGSILTLPLRLWRRQLCPITVIGPSSGAAEESPHDLQEARGSCLSPATA